MLKFYIVMNNHKLFKIYINPLAYLKTAYNNFLTFVW